MFSKIFIQSLPSGIDENYSIKNTYRIHHKSRSVPIRADAHQFKLIINSLTFPKHLIRRARTSGKKLLIFPLPDFLNKLLSAEIVSSKTPFTFDFLLHHHLSSDSCVIAARIVKHGFPLHTIPLINQNNLIDLIFC